MITPRVSPLPFADAHAAAAEIDIPDYVADIDVFRVLLRHPPLARALNDMLGPLLLRSTLDARLRELVIMRVAWVTGSGYEWAQHWVLGPRFGAPSDDLAAARDWETSGRFGSVERAIFTVTDETLAGRPVSDAAWAALGDAVPGVEQRMELLMLVGGYQMLSGVLRSLGVALDDGLEVWPPDGRRPDGAVP